VLWISVVLEYAHKPIVINKAILKIVINFSWYSYEQVLAVITHRAWRTGIGFILLSPSNG